MKSSDVVYGKERGGSPGEEVGFEGMRGALLLWCISGNISRIPTSCSNLHFNVISFKISCFFSKTISYFAIDGEQKWKK